MHVIALLIVVVINSSNRIHERFCVSPLQIDFQFLWISADSPRLPSLEPRTWFLKRSPSRTSEGLVVFICALLRWEFHVEMEPHEGFWEMRKNTEKKPACGKNMCLFFWDDMSSCLWLTVSYGPVTSAAHEFISVVAVSVNEAIFREDVMNGCTVAPLKLQSGRDLENQS